MKSCIVDSDRVPILLFNEADAVLGTRMEGASRAVDKMENSIQNIILQEMEKLHLPLLRNRCCDRSWMWS